MRTDSRDVLRSVRGRAERRAHTVDPKENGSIAAPRKGRPDSQLHRRGGIQRRFLGRFQDPAFRAVQGELTRRRGWRGTAIRISRKSPHTRKAGPGFADPDYDLAVDWIAARERSTRRRRGMTIRHEPSRILLINGSPRSEHTCPGRDVEVLAAARDRASEPRRDDGDMRSRGARSVAARLRIRPQHPSLQGLLLDRGGALPLAVLLLSRTIRSARRRTG